MNNEKRMQLLSRYRYQILIIERVAKQHGVHKPGAHVMMAHGGYIVVDGLAISDGEMRVSASGQVVISDPAR